MKVTDRLKVEHGIFLRQLRYLEQLLSLHAPKPALATAVETICRAEEQHAALEDRVLYPELTKLLGADHPALLRLGEDHGAIRRMLGLIRSGDVEEESIRSLVHLLRDHMEREIHQIFPLAEELLSEETLSTLSNWNAEHVREALESGEKGT